MRSNPEKVTEYLQRWKDSLNKELPNLINKAVEEKDEWFFIAMKALISANQEQKEHFVKNVLGKHIGFSDGSVWREDLLFP